MNRARRKRSLTLALAILLFIAVQLNSATGSLSASLDEVRAAVSADNAAIHVMPSRFATKISICFQGQRLEARKPSIFGFYRARCNKVDGWISHDHITLTD